MADDQHDQHDEPDPHDPHDEDDELDDDFDLSGVAPAGGFYQAPEGFRSGFASFVGRPNAGKSTLTNALVGQKIVITSSKPQTTRNVVRGIVHRDDAQLILVDLLVLVDPVVVLVLVLVSHRSPPAPRRTQPRSARHSSLPPCPRARWGPDRRRGAGGRLWRASSP